MTRVLVDELYALRDWLCYNELKMNANKTKSVCLNTNRCCDVPEISIDYNMIEVVSHVKFLGFIIDCKLYWNASKHTTS